jgi:hypothetical protein
MYEATPPIVAPAVAESGSKRKSKQSLARPVTKFTDLMALRLASISREQLLIRKSSRWASGNTNSDKNYASTRNGLRANLR